MPAALSGPRGLRCWGKYPGAFPRFSAFSPGRRGAGCAHSLVRPGRSALPETVPRGEAIHISAPLSLGSARSLVRPKRPALQGEVPRGEAIHISAPLSLGSARSLVRPIFLCCSLYHAPGLFPCLFILPLAGPASHPAYAPAATSPARYRAGRSKQHHHARNVKPLPPSGESEGHTPRAGGGEGGHLPVPLAFFASFWQKKEETPFLYAL